MPRPGLRLGAAIMRLSGDRARRSKKRFMTPHWVQRNLAASDVLFVLVVPLVLRPTSIPNRHRFSAMLVTSWNQRGTDVVDRKIELAAGRGGEAAAGNA